MEDLKYFVEFQKIEKFSILFPSLGSHFYRTFFFQKMETYPNQIFHHSLGGVVTFTLLFSMVIYATPSPVANAQYSTPNFANANSSVQSLPSIQSSTQSSQTSSEVLIPSWIKNNAKWWSQGQIEDEQFIEGIQYMIQKGIIQMPITQLGSSSNSETQQIPQWFKNTAGWWAAGQVSDDEFVKAIQYQISQGLLSTGNPSSSINNSTMKFETFNAWEKYITKVPVPRAGCFNAKYPSTVWQQTQCITAPLVPLQPSHAPTGGNNVQPFAVGAGNDWSAEAPSGQLITSSGGQLSGFSQSTSETDSNIGPNYPNEFTLQLNSQTFGPVSTSYTDNNSNYANSWEQFIMFNDPKRPEAVIFIQYWLLNYAASNGGNCPTNGPPGGSPWLPDGMGSCWGNSPGTIVPIQTVSNLNNVGLWGQVLFGSDDIDFCDSTAQSCSAVAATDQVLNLSQYWNQAEFNIFGAGNYGEANFNSGTSVTVTNTVMTNQGQDVTLTCNNSGFTAETNNLNIVQQYWNPPGNLEYCHTDNNYGKITFSETNSPFTFTMTTPSSQSIFHGGSATFSFDVTTTSGVPQPVTLSLAPKPSFQGESLSWNQNPATMGNGFTITPNPGPFGTPVQLTVQTSCSPNYDVHYTMQIWGTGGGTYAESNPFHLNEMSSPFCQTCPTNDIFQNGLCIPIVPFAPQFQLILYPSQLSIPRGHSGNTIIVAKSVSGFSSIVGLNLLDVPQGVSYSFVPPSVNLPSNHLNRSNLIINVGSSAPTGVHTMYVIGIAGQTARYVPLILNIS